MVSVNYTPTHVGGASATLRFGPGNQSLSLSGSAKALTNSNIVITIDRPVSGGAVSGKFTASGWALANNDGIQNISYTIDQAPGSNSDSPVNYGYSRADVCQVYPGRFGCPYVGWSVDLDVTNFTPGPHVLYIKAVTQTFETKVVSTPLTVFASTTPAPFLYLFQIDQPAPGATLSGMTSLYGWVTNGLGFPQTSVQISVDGAILTFANANESRADVCVVYPANFSCPNVGWSYVLDTTQLPDGPHTLSFSQRRNPLGLPRTRL